MSDEILTAAITIITEEFDWFIGCCLDENEQPKAPSYREIARARGFMVEGCQTAYAKKEADNA